MIAVLAFLIASGSYPAHWWAPVNDPHKPDWEILPQAARPGEVILSKRNELGILSNFAATPFVYRGKKYASVEGFWQMMLYPEGPDDLRARTPGNTWRHTREQVSQMISFQAKEAGTLAETNMRKMGIDWVTFEGKRIPYRSATKGEHYRLIRAAMLAKLNQNAHVRSILLSTGNLILRPDHIQEPDAPPEWAYFQMWMEIRSDLQRSAATALDFSDEPTFVVAGITDGTYMGGHGPDAGVQNSESLVKAAAALKASALATPQTQSEQETALADSRESSGDALEAARHYGRAVELDASESNLFNFGTELLSHGAPQQALQVFESGLRKFPRSTHLMLGAGVAFYAQGRYAEAAHCFYSASDLAPADPEPYRFLARTNNPEITATPEYLEHMRRFAEVHATDAEAEYQYALALRDHRLEPAKVESLLKNSVALAPDFADAHLLLGIVYAESGDRNRAESEYSRAIQSDPTLQEAHYRLAAAYRKDGEFDKAEQELQTFRSLQSESHQRRQQERSQLQRFIIQLQAPAN